MIVHTRAARAVVAACWVVGSSSPRADAQEAVEEPGQESVREAAAAPIAADEVAAVLARSAEELAKGRAAEAEDLLRDALRRARDPALLLELGAVLIERANALDGTSDLGQSLRQGVLEEARSTYEEAGKASGSRVAGATGAAICHALLGRPEAAEATLRAALAEARRDAGEVKSRRQLVSELVRYLAVLDRDDDARAVIAEASSAGELATSDARLEELRIAAVHRDEAQAWPLALAAIDANADGFQTAFLCWDAVQDGRLETLLNLYSKLLEKRPGDPGLLYFRGVTRLRLGDGAGAASDLVPCLGAPEFGERARLQLGLALLRENRSEESLAHFDQLIAGTGELVPEALNGLIGVAVAQARLRQFPAALDLFRRVLARDPYSFWARIGEPLCLKSLGDLDAAATAYEEGLTAFPEHPQLLNDYALLLKARGERAKAKELFERALGASGESLEEQKAAADGGENLGIIAYRDDHDLAAAGRYFARALLLDPNRPRVRFYRELCLCDGAQ